MRCLIETCIFGNGLSVIKCQTLFIFRPNKDTTEHSLRVNRNRIQIQLRVGFFTNKVLPFWNRLPENIVSCSSMDESKADDMTILGTMNDF